jgi:hypothetical protein
VRLGERERSRLAFLDGGASGIDGEQGHNGSAVSD